MDTMQQATDLIAFVQARLAEDDERWRFLSDIGEQGYWDFLLDDIAAKRHIIAAVERYMDPHPGVPCTNDDDPWDSCDLHVQNQQRSVNPFALRLLALPYADHPDYREEWRP